VATIKELKKETTKRERDDGVVARLIEGLVSLVPEAANAVLRAFGTPALGEIAGPITKWILDKMKDKLEGE